MKNWKIVGNIAAGSGIIAVVFGVFAAILTFQELNVYYAYPIGFIMLDVLKTMLSPFLLVAGISFVIAWFAMHAEKETPDMVIEEEVKLAAEPEPEEKIP